MPAYLIVDTDLTAPERYEDYKRQAKPLAEQYGGEYLVRGGAMDLKENDLWSPTRMVVVRFPSVEKAQAFYLSAPSLSLIHLLPFRLSDPLTASWLHLTYKNSKKKRKKEK